MTPTHAVAILLVAIGLSSHYVAGYQGGAPASGDICESMIPGHKARPQDPATNPYTVTVSNLRPKGGETVLITLNAPASQPPFKAGDKTTNLGRFNATYAPAVSQAISCFGNSRSAMTHVSGSEKNSVTVAWIAPNENLDGLEITSTFVKTGSEYWTHISHPEKLTVVKDNDLTTQSPIEGGISDELRRRLQTVYKACGESTGCFGFPDNCVARFLATQSEANPKTCTILTSFAAVGERNVYTLVGRPSTDDSTTGYIALGMSDDVKMGQDSVVGCFINSGTPAIHRFYNPGKSNTKAESPSLGLVSKSASLDDGYLFCEFEQTDHDVPGLGVKLRDSKYHYLLARGTSASPNGLTPHGAIGADASPSSDAIHITDLIIFGGENNKRILIQLHGSIMIVAWLLCASTGMFTARYYKLTHTDVMPFKKAFWFVLHLFCMFSTAILTVVGAILIIVYKKEYSFKSSDKVHWHPILGTVLFGLAFFQVCIAFMRPHPGTKMRPIFNWVHWTIGNSAHIVGIACIFLANGLQPANLEKDEYMFIMMGAVLFHIVMHLIMSFHTLWADKQMDTKSKRAVVPGPMKPNGLSSEAPGTGFRSGMLVIYFLGLFGCAAALLYFVCRPLEVLDA
ncbi:putative ferric-chelate reductase 1 [Folsomia candida]|uniref:Putative ferric-chelate reductase 1 n=1 Tax=Folsomia candida TaxID=158441 RepID=A0A226E091_FOLCA|nr:putative ferric-chelate reductase 1 [Folsomia candida]